METALAFVQALSDQDGDKIMSQLSDDLEFHWVLPGFDALGPRVKNKEQSEKFYRSLCGTLVTDFKVDSTSESLRRDVLTSLRSSFTIMLRCQEKSSSR